MRTLRIALIVSVALNLLVAGVLVGAWLDHGAATGRGCAAPGRWRPSRRR